MFTFPSVIMLIVFIVSMIAYFIMMSNRLNMKLWLFFAVSMSLTAATLFAAFKIFSVWNILAVPQCILYDAGSLIHLLTGKKTVKDVTLLK